MLPKGTSFLSLFGPQMPGLKGWPHFTDNRLARKPNRSRRAPMCVRFQAVGECTTSCTLAHTKSSAFTETEFSLVEKRFGEIYL